MKLLGTMLASFMSERDMRRNLTGLLRLLVFLLVVVAIFTVVFHALMVRVEGQEYSWFTGVYWTFTVMSTLGFGDITFHSDIGRAFSMVVLFTGVILLLIVLPFAFIRSFYAPWLEAQLRLRAPRRVPPGTTGHVIIGTYEAIAAGLVKRLQLLEIPHFVIEPDPTRAAQLHADHISTVTGATDDKETYENVLVDRARLVLANLDDVANTSVALTVREVAKYVPIAALVENLDSIDILELADCTTVMPLKQRLGQQLALRANLGHTEAHVVGRFRNLLVAEFPAHATPVSGKTVAESRLHEITGVSVVGIWDRAHMLRATHDTLISDRSVPVVVGTQEMIDNLNEYLHRSEPKEGPVLIIGGGKVGRAAARALKTRGARVHMIEKKTELVPRIGDLPDRLFIGDAANRALVDEAGIQTAPSVLLTTNDDAINIYLTVYARRLRPDVLIVSRLTHDRNIDSIHRAGADLVLSYATLGVQTILSLIMGRESVILGEGVELLDVRLPRSLVGKTLGKSEIRERTGMNVVVIHELNRVVTNPTPDHVLSAGSALAMIGDQQRFEKFVKVFGTA